MVDDMPAPYGDLSALTGTLTGTLASEDAIDIPFYQGGWTGSPCYDGPCSGTITLVPPPAIAVEIDIKPGSDRNPINPFSRGVIPVAILGADTFDVAEVNVTTLAFGPDGAAPAHKKGGHWGDVNDDGVMDLVSHYRTPETAIAFGDEETCVAGETLDGVPFEGCDTISTLVPCGNGYAAALVLPLLWIGRRGRRKRP
jgi:hypothetical protein